MGIDLICNNKTFSCSYGFWNTIRTEVIIATSEYLNSLNSRELEEGTFPFVARENIIGFMNELISYKNKKEDVDDVSTQGNYGSVSEEEEGEIPLISLFLGNCSLQILDLLIYFSIGGLYAFCNKSDCEGYYSIGNSYDIVELLNLIKPYTLRNNENLDSQENEIYKCICKIQEIFEESVNDKLFVIIS